MAYWNTNVSYLALPLVVGRCTFGDSPMEPPSAARHLLLERWLAVRVEPRQGLCSRLRAFRCTPPLLPSRKAAGFKVVMEATQGPAESYRHPHLPPDAYLVCR